LTSNDWVTVVKPFGCVNVAASALPFASCAAVVTRILYVVVAARGEAGVKVNVASPFDAVAEPIAMQFVKPSLDTWAEPEHAPSADCPVIMDVVIGCENVTAI